MNYDMFVNLGKVIGELISDDKAAREQDLTALLSGIREVHHDLSFTVDEDDKDAE